MEKKRKSHKFEVVDHEQISKYKNIFTKGFSPNWTDEVFVTKRVKSTVPWTHDSDLNGKEIVGTF